jgi:ATP-binding cassette subfamily C protein
LSSFLRHARWRVAWSAALLVAVALLEAAGLLLLMPLVEMLGLGQVQVAAGLAGVWRRIFAILGVAPGFELVLCSFVGLLILQAVLRRVSDHHNARIEASYAAHLRDRLYASLVRAQWLAFTRLRAADLTRALTQEVDNAGFAAQQGVVLAGLAGLAVVHLTVALILSPPLTALALGCGVAVAVALRPLNRRAHEAGKASQQCRTELGAVISEHLAGFKVAKSHGRSGYHLDLFRRATHAIAEHLVAARHTFSASRVFFELAGWTALMAFLYVAVKWARLELAQLVLMVFVFTRLLPRIGAIQTTWQHMVHYQPAFDAVEKLRVELDGSREELAEATGTLELKREVRLDQVTFRHDATAGCAAVREVSLTIPARRMTALVGASGAGKSTLADLVLGLLTPTEGRVLVDGEPVSWPECAQLILRGSLRRRDFANPSGHQFREQRVAGGVQVAGRGDVEGFVAGRWNLASKGCGGVQHVRVLPQRLRQWRVNPPAVLPEVLQVTPGGQQQDERRLPARAAGALELPHDGHSQRHRAGGVVGPEEIRMPRFAPPARAG